MPTYPRRPGEGRPSDAPIRTKLSSSTKGGGGVRESLGSGPGGRGEGSSLLQLPSAEEGGPGGSFGEGPASEEGPGLVGPPVKVWKTKEVISSSLLL